MTVIKKNQHSACLCRHIMNWGNELRHLIVIIKVIIADRSRGIEPVAVSAMQSEIADCGRSSGGKGHKAFQLWLINRAFNSSFFD